MVILFTISLTDISNRGVKTNLRSLNMISKREKREYWKLSDLMRRHNEDASMALLTGEVAIEQTGVEKGRVKTNKSSM